MTVAQVRKAVVAGIGAAVVLAGAFGVVLGADVAPGLIAGFDAVVAILVTIGVFKAENAPVE